MERCERCGQPKPAKAPVRTGKPHQGTTAADFKLVLAVALAVALLGALLGWWVMFGIGAAFVVFSFVGRHLTVRMIRTGELDEEGFRQLR